MKTKTKTIDKADRLYDQAVAPIIKKAGQWGYVVALAKAFSARTGRTVHRNVIDLWLHPDPAKRVHPDYGNVVLLLLAAEDADKVFAARAEKKTKAASSKKISVTIPHYTARHVTSQHPTTQHNATT